MIVIVIVIVIKIIIIINVDDLNNFNLSEGNNKCKQMTDNI